MRQWINLVSEQTLNSLKTIIPVLYHGTCEDSAKHLVENGWHPNGWSIGGNMGQSKYLYLTSDREDAMWFAEEKGCSSIVEVLNVPLSFLKVDPEDGIADTVQDELNNKMGLPGKVVLTAPLGPEHFRHG